MCIRDNIHSEYKYHCRLNMQLDLQAYLGSCVWLYSLAETRVSFETSFDSKQPKLEPKLVSTLSETKRLFRLFRFLPKQRVSVFRLNRNKQKIN